jgi:hypothetical protein
MGPPPELMNVVSGTYHDSIPVHSLQQITRATAPSGSAWRQSLRPQPAAGPARTPRDATASRPAPRGVPDNHSGKHRGAGRTLSVAPRCGKTTALKPVSTVRADSVEARALLILGRALPASDRSTEHRRARSRGSRLALRATAKLPSSIILKMPHWADGFRPPPTLNLSRNRQSFGSRASRRITDLERC